MLPIWLLAELTIMIYYWRFWEPWAGSMLVVLLPKLWFWIRNHDWHNCFWMSLWLFVGWTLTGPKKSFKIKQFYIIDWIRKKLLVDVANLATCWTNDYDILLEVLEPWAGSMLVVLLPKLWFWIGNHDWHNCFWMSLWLFCGVNLYWTQKSFKVKNFT